MAPSDAGELNHVTISPEQEEVMAPVGFDVTVPEDVTDRTYDHDIHVKAFMDQAEKAFHEEIDALIGRTYSVLGDNLGKIIAEKFLEPLKQPVCLVTGQIQGVQRRARMALQPLFDRVCEELVAGEEGDKLGALKAAFYESEAGFLASVEGVLEGLGGKVDPDLLVSFKAQVGELRIKMSQIYIKERIQSVIPGYGVVTLPALVREMEWEGQNQLFWDEEVIRNLVMLEEVLDMYGPLVSAMNTSRDDFVTDRNSLEADFSRLVERAISRGWEVPVEVTTFVEGTFDTQDSFIYAARCAVESLPAMLKKVRHVQLKREVGTRRVKRQDLEDAESELEKAMAARREAQHAFLQAKTSLRQTNQEALRAQMSGGASLEDAVDSAKLLVLEREEALEAAQVTEQEGRELLKYAQQEAGVDDSQVVLDDETEQDLRDWDRLASANVKRMRAAVDGADLALEIRSVLLRGLEDEGMPIPEVLEEFLEALRKPSNIRKFELPRDFEPGEVALEDVEDLMRPFMARRDGLFDPVSFDQMRSDLRVISRQRRKDRRLITGGVTVLAAGLALVGVLWANKVKKEKEAEAARRALFQGEVEPESDREKVDWVATSMVDYLGQNSAHMRYDLLTLLLLNMNVDYPETRKSDFIGGSAALKERSKRFEGYEASLNARTHLARLSLLMEREDLTLPSAQWFRYAMKCLQTELDWQEFAMIVDENQERNDRLNEHIRELADAVGWTFLAADMAVITPENCSVMEPVLIDRFYFDRNVADGDDRFVELVFSSQWPSHTGFMFNMIPPGVRHMSEVPYIVRPGVGKVIDTPSMWKDLGEPFRCGTLVERRVTPPDYLEMMSEEFALEISAMFRRHMPHFEAIFLAKVQQRLSTEHPEYFDLTSGFFPGDLFREHRAKYLEVEGVSPEAARLLAQLFYAAEVGEESETLNDLRHVLTLYEDPRAWVQFSQEFARVNHGKMEEEIHAIVGEHGWNYLTYDIEYMTALDCDKDRPALVVRDYFDPHVEGGAYVEITYRLAIFVPYGLGGTAPCIRVIEDLPVEVREGRDGRRKYPNRELVMEGVSVEMQCGFCDDQQDRMLRGAAGNLEWMDEMRDEEDQQLAQNPVLQEIARGFERRLSQDSDLVRHYLFALMWSDFCENNPRFSLYNSFFGDEYQGLITTPTIQKGAGITAAEEGEMMYEKAERELGREIGISVFEQIAGPDAADFARDYSRFNESMEAFEAQLAGLVDSYKEAGWTHWDTVILMADDEKCSSGQPLTAIIKTMLLLDLGNGTSRRVEMTHTMTWGGDHPYVSEPCFRTIQSMTVAALPQYIYEDGELTPGDPIPNWHLLTAYDGARCGSCDHAGTWNLIEGWQD